MNAFRIVSVNVSRKKGERKSPVPSISLRPAHGVEGDAHAGDWHRQVSLLAAEDIEYMRGKGAQVGPGDFAENITTRNVDLSTLQVGDRLMLGECELEVTQIGKECHSRCSIYMRVGDCVMPREGLFARVVRGGWIQVGNEIGVKPQPALCHQTD